MPAIKHFMKPAKLEKALAGHIENIANKLDHFDDRLDTIDGSLDDLMGKIKRNE